MDDGNASQPAAVRKTQSRGTSRDARVEERCEGVSVVALSECVAAMAGAADAAAVSSDAALVRPAMRSPSAVAAAAMPCMAVSASR